jgi:RNA polymerase sigma-70 factor (ECF subfamily)
MTVSNARIEPPPASGDDAPFTLANDAAFEALFRAYHAPLCAFVNRIVLAPAVAEELVQEVFLYLWEHRATWVAHTSARQYLFTAARHAALNHVRRERLEYTVRHDDAVIGRFAQEPAAADRALDQGEFTHAVRRAIRRLPDRCRLVYTLSREQHLSYAEIAGVLQISQKTVEVQMGRAFKLLRQYLSTYRNST